MLGTPRAVRAFAALVWAFCALAAGCGQSARPSILLVTVDTLRRDRIATYGGPDALAPNIARLAREGAFAAEAYAPFGRTTQSVGTILTGLHPLEHGADGLGMPLPDGARTLAEQLRDGGYRTAAFTSNVFLRPGLGFERGFEIYANPRPRWHGNSATQVTAEALAWIDAQGEAPWFLWVHYLDPHWGYDPPPEFERRLGVPPAAQDSMSERLRGGHAPDGSIIFAGRASLPEAERERLRALYDAEVAATDAAIGTLADALRASGRLDRTVLVLTSDHGESLGEHEYWFAHGEYIYDSTLAVPLILRGPGIARGTRIEGLAAHEDIAPTVRALAGVAPGGHGGRNLLAPAEASRHLVHLADHKLVHEENPRRTVPGREGRWWAVRQDELKLIVIPRGTEHEVELYDLASDPGELRNVAAERPAEAARLRALLDDQRRVLLAAFQRSGAQEAAPGDVDAETLRSLGYVR